MSFIEELHLNDIGTILRVTIKDKQSDGSSSVLDISGATTKQIILLKPGGDKLTKTASFYTDGSDGIIQYTTVEGDIDEVGRWQIQGSIVTSGGEWKTDISNFKVLRNL